MKNKLPLKLQVKLASIVVHCEEMLSPDGHDADRIALTSLLADDDVREWIEQMTERGLAPVRRK